MLYHSSLAISSSTGAGSSGAVSHLGKIGAAALFLVLSAVSAQAEPPAVVASFKPVHSLVAAIMEGVGTPSLLVKGAASPHTYALTPRDAAALQDAKLIFWIGDGLEHFLHKAIDTLPQNAKSVELAGIAGLTVLPMREGGLWDEHMHEGEEAGEDREEEPYDGHLWLDPTNAGLMAETIVHELSAADPADAAVYRANGDKLQRRLDALDQEIAASLAPVKNVPFIVFHDAYQYFDRHYGLAGVGSITVNPEQPPGAKRLNEIREKIVNQGARCVFREPNFEPALVDTVVAETDAKTGVLDPEGAGLSEGPELYFQLMRGIAGSLKACLSTSS
jgi:zinc transport system substrate-binding protein